MRRTSFLFVSVAPLSFPRITQCLQHLHGWRVDGNNHNAICRDFEFSDFAQAMAFMNAVADDCEAAQHHPHWTNTFNKVHVQLNTHDAGGRVTQKDVDLAQKMNESLYLMIPTCPDPREALLLSPHALAARLDVTVRESTALLRQIARNHIFHNLRNTGHSADSGHSANIAHLAAYPRVCDLGDFSPLPLGCAALDAALRGGLPRAAVVEFCGAPGGGAAALAAHCARSAPGGALWIAADGAAPADALSAAPFAAGPFAAGPFAAGPSAAGPSAAGPFAAGPSAAGPFAAGPSAAGPSAAGPFAAGPSAAGPFAAGPFAAGPFAAGPSAAGPFAAGPRGVAAVPAADLAEAARRLRAAAGGPARFIVLDGLPLLARRSLAEYDVGNSDFGGDGGAAGWHEGIGRVMQCAKATAKAVNGVVVVITHPGAALGRAFAHAVNARLHIRRGGTPGEKAAYIVDIEKSAVAAAARVIFEVEQEVETEKGKDSCVALLDVAHCCADPAGYAIVPTVVYC